ncbi:MAG: hypothetical protein QXY07_02635 [Candidatus Bathyarchaeia archaeon]
MTDDEIREWMNAKFEEVWQELLRQPRAHVIKHTRKYVAKLFFVAGLKAAMEVL